MQWYNYKLKYCSRIIAAVSLLVKSMLLYLKHLKLIEEFIHSVQTRAALHTSKHADTYTNNIKSVITYSTTKVFIQHDVCSAVACATGT